MKSLELKPYFIPHVGQYKMIMELRKPIDRFHTYRTRSCANIRDRNLIISPEYENELIGNEKFKAKSQMATEIDENYRSEFYHERSRTQFRYQPITEMIELRESLRKKMDVYWMKERFYLDQIYSFKQEVEMKKIKEQIADYQNFLVEYKETSFHLATKTMQEVKRYYQETDQLRRKHVELQNIIEPVKMKIFALANELIRLQSLKKFQYLLKPNEWRLAHDYLHRDPMGKLENYRECILNRGTANLWNRNNENVHSIKDFVEKVFINENRESLLVFGNGSEMLKAIKNLRSKSYRSLLQFHLVAHAVTDTKKDFITTEEKNQIYIENLNRFVKTLTKKRTFMESRSAEIKRAVLKISEKPLEESFAADTRRTLHGLCEVLFQKVVLKRSDPSVKNYYTATEKIEEVEKMSFKLLDTLDSVPHELTCDFEKRIRNELKRKLIVAERAYKIELGFSQRIEQLHRCLSKPPKKEKRVGKLSISVLPKMRTKHKVEKPLLTPIEEEYMRAFTEVGSCGEVKFDKSAKLMIDRIKNESIPFYLDHFLSTLGINLPKQSPDIAENILLDEAENLKFKDVIPIVRSQVKKWDEQSEAVKRENIRKTPYLYQ